MNGYLFNSYIEYVGCYEDTKYERFHENLFNKLCNNDEVGWSMFPTTLLPFRVLNINYGQWKNVCTDCGPETSIYSMWNNGTFVLSACTAWTCLDGFYRKGPTSTSMAHERGPLYGCYRFLDVLSLPILASHPSVSLNNNVSAPGHRQLTATKYCLWLLLDFSDLKKECLWVPFGKCSSFSVVSCYAWPFNGGFLMIYSDYWLCHLVDGSVLDYADACTVSQHQVSVKCFLCHYEERRIYTSLIQIKSMMCRSRESEHIAGALMQKSLPNCIPLTEVLWATQLERRVLYERLKVLIKAEVDEREDAVLHSNKVIEELLAADFKAGDDWRLQNILTPSARHLRSPFCYDF